MEGTVLARLGTRLAGLALAILGALLACAVPAQARESALLETCVARQLPGDQPEAMLAQPQRFACGTKQSALGPGNYWVTIALPPKARQESLSTLVYVPNLQENSDLYYRGDNGALTRVPLDGKAVSRRTQIGARIEVPLRDSALKDGRVLVRIDNALNATGLLQNAQLLEYETAHRIELNEMAVYAAFAGLCLALLVYNLVMWLAMRERFQLIYCGSVVAMLIYAGSHSGAMDLLFPEIGAYVRFRINYVALASLAVLSVQFIAAFLPPQSLPRWLRLTMHGSTATTMVIALAIPFLPIEQLYWVDRLYVASFLPIPPLAIAMCLYGWHHDRDATRVMVLAWSLPVLMAGLRIFHAFNVIGYSSLVEHSVVFAMSSEALLSSLAMALRVRHILVERDLARAEEGAARRLAEIDPLTGLHNRRALLSNAIQMAPGEPLRLLLVDIDFFKSINDTYGHNLGDEVLREVASSLARSLEIRGVCARMGGEEFALLGPAEDLPEDLALEVLAETRSLALPEGIRITVSIGQADGLVECEADWRDLYRRADTALYDAKHSGRNCHIVAPGGVDYGFGKVVALA